MGMDHCLVSGCMYLLPTRAKIISFITYLQTNTDEVHEDYLKFTIVQSRALCWNLKVSKIYCCMYSAVHLELIDFFVVL